jgi:hypothetical protein
MCGLWGTTELWVLIENSQCLRKNSWYFTGYGLWGLWVKTVTTVYTGLSSVNHGLKYMATGTGQLRISASELRQA